MRTPSRAAWMLEDCAVAGKTPMFPVEVTSAKDLHAVNRTRSIRHWGFGFGGEGPGPLRPCAPTSWKTPKGVSWNTPTAPAKEATLAAKEATPPVLRE